MAKRVSKRREIVRKERFRRIKRVHNYLLVNGRYREAFELKILVKHAGDFPPKLPKHYRIAK